MNEIFFKSVLLLTTRCIVIQFDKVVSLELLIDSQNLIQIQRKTLNSLLHWEDCTEKVLYWFCAAPSKGNPERENMYAHPANIYVQVTEKEWFITNPVHKTGDIVEAEVASYLTCPESANPGEDSLEKLYNQGYATEEPVSLPEVYRNLPPEKGAPVSFSVAVTYACDLQCAYCFQRADPHLPKDACLDKEKISSLVSAVDALKRKFLVLFPSDYTVEFTGGEPLLPANRSIIEHLLDTFRRDPILITTNGIHILDFAELLSGYRVRLKVTLDGTPSVHDGRKKTLSREGTYHKIVEGVEKACTAGIPVSVKVNIDPDNVKDLPHLVDQFRSYGWTDNEKITLGLARVRETLEYSSVWTTSEYVEHVCFYLEKYNLQEYFEIFFPGHQYFHDIILGEKPETSIYKCRTDRNYFFSPDGLIYVCIRMTQNPVGRFFPQFSVDEEQVTQLLSRNIKTMSKCLECPYALICGGGCPADSMKEHGHIFHPMCVDYSRILKAYIPYLLRTASRK